MTFAVLAAVAGWAIYAIRAAGGSLRGSLARLAADSKSSLRRILNGQGSTSGALFTSLRVVLFTIAAACVTLLALTGFVPYIVWGESVSGLSLMVHVVLAPVFAVCLTMLTLLWAHRHRLDIKDFGLLASFARRRSGLPAGAGQISALKLSFWAMVVLAPLIMGSIMLSMYPLFGTPGQRFLLSLHLVSGLLFVVVAVVQVVVLVATPNLTKNERRDLRGPVE